jgi:hypothetical protein
MSLIEQIRARAADEKLRTDMAQHGGGFWFETLSESEIVRAESRLGRRLPSLLRAAYSEIGNGGFGPGYGLLPLILVETPPGHETVVDIYLALAHLGTQRNVAKRAVHRPARVEQVAMGKGPGLRPPYPSRATEIRVDSDRMPDPDR